MLAYGLAATLATLTMVRTLVAQHDKRLLIMLSYGAASVIDALEGRPRSDQALLGDLVAHEDLVVDGLAAHVDDYGAFSLTPERYCRRYLAGHYTPTGNAFFAFAVKDALVDWLHPAPIAYPERGRGAPSS